MEHQVKTEECGNCNVPGLIPEGMTEADCIVCGGLGVTFPCDCPVLNGRHSNECNQMRGEHRIT